MRWTNYWATLFYNGVVIGIWPAAALAYLLTTHQRTLTSFMTVFLISMALLIPSIMWLYHAVILRRRRSRGQIRQK